MNVGTEKTASRLGACEQGGDLACVPTVISLLITVVYNMADTFFIGQLCNPDQVAAATLAMPVFMLITAFANFFGIAWATPLADALALIVSLSLTIPYIKALTTK